MNILTLNEETLLTAIWSIRNNADEVTIIEKIQGASRKKTFNGG